MRLDRVSKMALLIGSASLTSRILGLLRDRLLAQNFAITRASDAWHSLDVYYAAFRIPDFIFTLLILGTLTSAFIPVFVEYLHKKSEKAAWELTNNFLNIILIILLLFLFFAFIFSFPLIRLLTPGFDQETQKVTVTLTRVMLLSPFLLVLSTVASSVLNAYKKFLAYSLAPVVYNLGIILGILFLAPKYAILGVAFGVVLGAFFHMIIQLPSLFKLGYRYQFIFNLKEEGIKKIGILIIPCILSLGITQIEWLVATIIASTLGKGSLAIFNLANNLQVLPVGIISIALATAVFPDLVEEITKERIDLFRQKLFSTIEQILFLIIPLSFFFYLLRAHFVRLILGTGLFNWPDTIATAYCVGLFAISLFAQSLIPVFNRSFYAFFDTKTPLKIAGFSAFVFVLTALIFPKLSVFQQFPVAGLALAFSVAAIVNVFLLAINLRKKIGGFNSKMIINIIQIFIASFISASALYATLYLVEQYFKNLFSHTTTFLFFQVLIASLIGVIIYLLVIKLLSKEILRKIYGK